MMDTVLLTVGIVLGVMLLLPLYRMVRGPTIYDRLAAAGTMGTKTLCLLLVMGFIIKRADMYVDISMGYGLALIVGTLVTAKYLETARNVDNSPETPEAAPGVGQTSDPAPDSGAIS